MGYFFYTISFFVLLTGTCTSFSSHLETEYPLTCLAVLYLTRTRWHPFLAPYISRLPAVSLPTSLTSPLYSRLPQSFMSDVENGLTSADFDLSSNVMEGDSRGGLDQKAKAAVQRIMKRRGVGFDEARRIYMQDRFRREGIGEDGVPRDPKFVSFS
jgi:hypothetical protein